jgi:hypothetical protein
MKQWIFAVIVVFLVGCTTLAATPTDTETAAHSRPGDTINDDSFVEIRRTITGDGGDLVLSYGQAQSERYQHWEGAVKDSGVFADSIFAMNNKYAFDTDIPVRITECEELAAYYDWKTKEVVTCYEMFDRFYALFFKEFKSKERAQEHAIDAMLFIFHHELGHALVDAYELPVTGREEDAADQFATLQLIEQGKAGAAIAGGEAFLLQGRDEGRLPLWGEHALDEQRYYNIQCWVYGSNPEEYEDLVGDTLPKDRAKRCEKEFRQMRMSWERILAEYEK